MRKEDAIRTFIKTSNTLFRVLSVPASFIALFSAVLMFSSPGSTDSPYTLLLACSMISLPLTIALSIPLSQFLHHRKKVILAAIVSLTPLFSGTFIVVALYLLFAVCDGNFVCSNQ